MKMRTEGMLRTSLAVQRLRLRASNAAARAHVNVSDSVTSLRAETMLLAHDCRPRAWQGSHTPRDAKIFTE